jgi:hypothetical protein
MTQLAEPVGKPPPDQPGDGPPKWGVARKDPDALRFLEGPQTRRFEAARIFFELIRGFRGLHFVWPCATVFGSARLSEHHRYYTLAREAGSLLSRGLYRHDRRRAGNPGSRQPRRQRRRRKLRRLQYRAAPRAKAQPYLDRWITFRHFHVRKLMLVEYSYGFIAMPGGFGTLDESFETATPFRRERSPTFRWFLSVAIIGCP